MKNYLQIIRYTLICISLSMILTACGGGGGGSSSSSDSNDDTTTETDTDTGTLSVIVADGYIYNATMTCDNGTATLNADNLTFTIDTLNPGNCEIQGGNHLINGTTIQNQTKLSIYIENGSAEETRYATPLTTLVSQSVQKGLSQELANKKVASMMGIDPDNSSDIDTLLYGDPTKLDQLSFDGTGNDFEAKKARNSMVALYTMMEHFIAAGANDEQLNNALFAIVNTISDSVYEAGEELTTTQIINAINSDLNTSTLSNQFEKIQQLLQIQEETLLNDTSSYTSFETLVESILEISDSMESVTATNEENTQIASLFNNLLNPNSQEEEEEENEESTKTITYAIVDTAQTTCYDSITGSEITCQNSGYDADYTGNTPNYTLNNNGTIITDNVTGLMWTQTNDLDNDGNTTDADDKLGYDDAITYCSNLVLGGYDDWRLPDIKTLYSLMAFTGEDPSSYSGTDTSSLITFLNENFAWAFGDQNADERIIDGQYATTTKNVTLGNNNSETMFGVNFVDGRIKSYPVSNKLFYVLCTRGNEQYGENDFTDNGDKTITDNATSLMWQQDDTQSSNFEDAVEYCESSTLANHDDWRLPNVKELHSIVDYSKSPDTTNSAAIDDIFNSTSFINEEGETDWGYYWSSTTHATSETGKSGAYVSFGRALGYMNNNISDVHGAGAQRSNSKMSENESGASTATGYNNETYYYKGPQGDILRVDNMVRCVRDTSTSNDSTVNVSNNDVSEGYILFSTMGDKDTYLVDTDKNVVKSYTSSYNAANASYLTSDYTLLRSGLTTPARRGTFSTGGAVGGIIEELDSNSNVIWSYTADSDIITLHHDFKQIDNDAIYALTWELKEYNGSDYWNEKVVKIDKNSQTITWSWSAMEDGGIYPTSSKADYIHFNSIDYKDGKLLLSSRAQNIIFEISESSKAILNQYTANNTLERQHDASYLDNGNILVFNNETDGTSSVVEIDSDDTIVWSYSNKFYSDHISGAQRLENGNTLICSGVEGEFIEVSNDKEELWSYNNPYTNSNTQSNSVFKIRKYTSYQ